MKSTFLALVFCSLPAILFAQAFQWTTFTSTSNVVDMTETQGEVWMATSGGLSGFDLTSRHFDIYTNTRGLAMNQCVAVGKDARGFIWAGLGDARITRINPHAHEVRQVVDLANDVFEINAIVDVGDEVFVAANNGIYRFAYYPAVDNYRVFEAIKVLGTFPGETRVAALAVAGGYLYAGTASGLARALLSSPQLNAPDVWQNFTIDNSPLPENSIVALQGYSGADANLLNLSTMHWVASLVDTTWFTQNIPDTANRVIDFANSDIHWAVGRSIVYHAVDRQTTWQPTGPTLPNISRIDVLPLASGATVVVGLGDSPQGSGGLVFSSDPANVPWSAPLSAPGIGGNYINSLGVDPQGRLWAGGGGSTAGVYSLQGDTWHNYSRSTGYQQLFFVNNFSVTGIAFDAYGGTWAASQGAGTAWIHGDSIIVFNTYDSTGFSAQGPRLAGIPGFPLFVVTRVSSSSSGDIYMTNRLSTQNLPLVRVPRSWIARGNNPDPWQYYTPGPPQVPNTQVEVEELIVDPFNRVWEGASHDGAQSWVLKTDSSWFNYVPSSRQDRVTCFEDINKQVLDFAIDQEGYLWVATVNGAYYTQGGIPQDLNQLRFICVVDLPIGHQVNAIHVDAQDNKWFGTDNGVAVLDKNFNWTYIFQTASSVDHPSDLISNNVLSITSNPQTGEIWIGTSDGLSRFSSAFVSNASGDLGSIWPYPNPFRADGTQHMRIDPARLGGKFDDLRVLTISGRLVKKLDWAGMTDPTHAGGWDGTNENGEFVAGGVYLLVASSNDGKSAVGKVAVLGR